MRAWLLLTLLLALPPPAAARQVGAIAFSPCELKAARVPGAVAAECASFEVPEDHAAPQGRRITLRIARVPSRAETPAPDPMVLLAGGPGQSAIEAYPLTQAAFRPLLARRDVLLVDQRGTGESSPLKCPLPDWKDPGESSDVAARKQAQDCLA